CDGCKLRDAGCQFKGLPKIFPTNLAALKSWQRSKEMGNALPKPGTSIGEQPNYLMEQFLIISDQMAIEQRIDQQLNQGQNG
ncbi:MAG: hypothetical protein L0Y74_08425, partial [candidate division Zixibacteria bacterium]|nr:hypothetical protein [candidate division Zixibacteria bacterium]